MGFITGGTHNESSQFLVIVPHDNWFVGAQCIRLANGEEADGNIGFRLNGGRQQERTTFSIVMRDSVVEVRTGREATAPLDSAFLLRNSSTENTSPPSWIDFVLIFTDEYLAELADTMRAMGISPYRVSHEYVVNSSRRDFTLRCVAPERTWEYEIASGDSADIERQWLMEWYGTEGGHYEFVFDDSTMTVWPADKQYYTLAGVEPGDDVNPRRYFDFTVSREGGGARRYEITDTLLREMATEMAKVRKAQPELFGR